MNNNRDRGNAATVVLAVILAIVLIIGISIGGYMLGWWIKEDTVNRTAQINQDSYGRQVALVDQINDDIREASDPDIPKAQRQAIVNQICESAGFLTGKVQVSAPAANFIATECGIIL